MKFKLFTIAVSSLLACSISNVFASPKTPATEEGFSAIEIMQMGQPKQINWVSVADIEQSLKGKPPIAVGFDIDDTVLFSSAGFYRGKEAFSPKDNAFLKSQKFWDKMNCEWEKFSLPKQIAKELIAMHQSRGDQIYFITARDPSSCEISTELLKKTFNIKKMHKVIFTGSSKTQYPKTPYIKANNIKLYYGDSDGDIISAQKAGAEGIRIVRPSNSTNKPIAKNGIYGEKVVKNSEF